MYYQLHDQLWFLECYKTMLIVRVGDSVKVEVQYKCKYKEHLWLKSKDVYEKLWIQKLYISLFVFIFLGEFI